MTDVRAVFGPLFDEIRRGAAARDVSREHPFEEMRALAAAGFGALRLPVDRGGHGATLPELFDALVELAAADSNMPQALRQHFFRVELILLSPDSPERDAWLGRIAGGDLFGNATSETAEVPIGSFNTVLRAEGDAFRLSGRKFYSTGNLFAQWIPVSAVDEEGNAIVVIVPADREGVDLADDWPGFGQRLTASGTTTFTDVRVEETEVQRFGNPTTHHGLGFHQLVLLATLAGIAKGAADDLVEQVAARTRVFSAGSGDLPRFDPIVQEAVGRALAAAYTARALIRSAATELERAWNGWADPAADQEEVSRAFAAADIAVSTAQVALVPLVLEQTSHIFDSLGASATATSSALDRHWRNARTVSSHNPWIYKARQIGDYALNGTLPPIFVAGADVGAAPAAG